MNRSNVVTASIQDVVQQRAERSIGAILVQEGRLTIEDAEKVLRVQREEGLQFGTAAIQLGVLTEADIEFALSQQFNYPCLNREDSGVSGDLVAAYGPPGPQLEALRTLRTQLLLRCFDAAPDHNALAIVSGSRQEGRSILAANLAIVFSQLGENTLLIDADMRHPRQHQLFGLENRNGLSAMLSGRSSRDVVKRIPGLNNLSVLVSGITPPNPLELLSRSAFPELLRDLGKEFDVILIDTPASSDCADAQTIAARAGSALIVVRNNRARMSSVRNLAQGIADAGAAIVGSVLNEF